MEPYLYNQELISKHKWHTYVAELRSRVRPATREDIRDAFVKAVLARAQDTRSRIGVLFSGGIDSTLIAWILKQSNYPFTCYTVGFQDLGTKEPEDVVEAVCAAQQLDFPQRVRIVDLPAAHKIFVKTANLLGELTTVVSLGIGSVTVIAAERAKRDGCFTLFSGLGSEEIFAGYHRHTTVTNIQEECWHGLQYLLWERDLRRDCTLAAELGVTILTPFLDERVIIAAMGIPASEKIKEFEAHSVKKYVLRQVAEGLGLPAHFVWRRKRAAQYGSRLDSAMDKLARRYEYKGKRQYAQALLSSEAESS